MKKTVLFAGIMMATVLIYQMYENRLTVDHTFDMVLSNNVGSAKNIVKEKDLLDYIVAPEVQKPKDLKILAFGDVMLGRYVRTLMDKNGKDYVFSGLDWENMTADYDVVHANLEGPINGKGKSGGTAMNFAFNQDVGPFLKEKGFTVVSIANNHALDAGWDARNETMDVLSNSGVGFCGHPTEAALDSVYFGEADSGTKYAFVCFHDVGNILDKDAALELIKKVKPDVDYLIVSIHWGIEYKNTASKRQVELGHGFVDAGADFVIGHHPHVVENFEIYNGVPIFYSLGNFIFDQYWAQSVQKELGLGIEITPDAISGQLTYRIELIPMKSENSKSRLMSDDETKKWLEEFIKYGNYDDAMKQMIRAKEIFVAK